MYQFMDRITVHSLHKRGWSNNHIGEHLGMHRNTVSQILKDSVTQKYKRPEQPNAATPYELNVRQWLEDRIPVKRMLELVQDDEDNPYEGSRAAFYAGVAKVREEYELYKKDRFVRFEGLPGEYAQIDWGEIRNFPFLRGDRPTRYFLAVRLKFSRLSFVKWTDSMTQEVLLRALIEACEYFGGVPWIWVFDNMKTVTIGRDDQGRPIWHRVFKHFAADLDFKPEACDRGCPNQKGSAESLVGWVKTNFKPGREFLDDADLARQSLQWVNKINNQVSQAHGEVPRTVFETFEKAKLTALPCSAEEYGLLRPVCSNRDGYVHAEGTQYLVPIGYAERPLILRLRQHTVEFHHDGQQVAIYERRDGLRQRQFKPGYLEPLLEERPRARVMVYRDYLCQKHPQIAAYIAQLCRVRRGDDAFGPHILKLYECLKEHGAGELAAACNLAGGTQAFGAEYVVALLQTPTPRPVATLLQVDAPDQTEVDRNLASYESFVIGGEL